MALQISQSRRASLREDRRDVVDEGGLAVVRHGASRIHTGRVKHNSWLTGQLIYSWPRSISINGLVDQLAPSHNAASIRSKTSQTADDNRCCPQRATGQRYIPIHKSLSTCVILDENIILYTAKT